MNENQDKKHGLPHRGLPNRPGKKPPLPRYKRGPFSYLIIAIAIFMVMMMLQQWQRVATIRWDEFVKHVESGNVEQIVGCNACGRRWKDVFQLVDVRELCDGPVT